MRNITKKSLTLGAVLGTTALTAFPAQAQMTQNPLYRHWDENGVDVTQGDFRLNFTEGSIGSGQAKLDLVRIQNNFSPSPWDQPILNQSKVNGVTITTARKPDGSNFVFNGSTSAAADGSTLLLTTDPATSNTAYQITNPSGVKYLYVDPIGTDGGATNFCSGNNDPCQQPLKSVTYPDGTVITLGIGTWHISLTNQYNWRLTGISNNFGYSINFGYQSNGLSGSGNAPDTWFTRTSASFRQNGVQQGAVSYSYPVAGTTDITDFAGKVWEVTNTSIKKPGDSAPSFNVTADGSGNVTSVVNQGVTTTYNRVVSGSTVTLTKTDPLNNAAVIKSDLNLAQITSTQDALNHTTTYGYDGNGRLTSVTYPENNKITYVLDGRGNAQQTNYVSKPKSDGTTTTISTYASFPCTVALACNDPASVTDANGNETDYTYDPNSGQVATITRPAAPNGVRPQTRYSYTLTNGVYLLTGISECQTTSSCAGGADEVKTTIGYDSYADPINVSEGSGNGSLTAPSAMTYDGMGDLLTVDGPLTGTADTIRYRYDAARRLIGTTSPSPGNGQPERAIRNTYDGAGRLTKKEAGTVTDQTDAAWNNFTPLQTVDIGLDSNGRVATQKLSAGGTTYALTQSNYDADGRPLCSRVLMNSNEFTSLPSNVCNINTSGTPDRITEQVYNAAGDVTQVQEAVGTTAATNERTVTYNPNGTIATAKDANNNVTSYTYDIFDRLTQVSYPGGSNDQVTLYDNNGNAKTIVNRAGQSTGLNYDALNRITSMTPPEGTISYTYDNLGHPLSIAQGTTTLSFAYDALGRNLTQVGPQGTVTSTWDLAGRRTSVAYPTASGWTTLTVNYNYLTTGEVSSIVDGSTTLVSYGYDALGNRASVTYGNGVSQTYSYDPVSQLTTLAMAGSNNNLTIGGSSSPIAYNPASEITSAPRSNSAYSFPTTQIGNVNRSYSVNALNQFTQTATGGSTTATFGYDSKGNLASSAPTGGSATYYCYDSANRLTASAANSACTSPTATLAYDPAGRLASLVTGNGTTNFAYDGLNLLAEYNGSTLVARYVFGPSADEPIVAYNSSSNRTWLTSDERGSIIALTNSSGTLTASGINQGGGANGINTYDEYGIPGSANSGRFQYTGQVYLSELGMYYYKARMYSTSLGRFMQTDPIGYGDGMNWYAYTHNDPVNGSDPTGLTLYHVCWPVYVPSTKASTGGSQGSPIVVYAGHFVQQCEDIYVDDGSNQTVQVGTGQSYQSSGGQQGHSYAMTDKICDGTKGTCHLDRTNSRRCVLPGRIGTQPIESGGLYLVYSGAYDIIPGGLVRSYQTGPHSFRNQTTWAHPFSGTVDRIFTQTADGSIYATTVGQGTAETTLQDLVNSIVGPNIFAAQDNRCAEILGN